MGFSHCVGFSRVMRRLREKGCLIDPPVHQTRGEHLKVCHAGFIGIERLMENFTESEVQQRWRGVVLALQKVPL